MEIADLDHAERIALIGLTHQIVKADKQLTPDEEAAVDTLAKRMGEDTFYALLEEARSTFKTRTGMESAVNAVTRTDARSLIFEILRDIAGSDGMDKLEAQILVWTARQWDITITRRAPPA